MTYLYHRNWSRQELAPYVGQMDQVAGIKLLEAADGIERGNRILQVWTGSGLSFNVLADRALDISACQYRGMSLTWRSAVGDAHPAYYDAAGAGFLRSFQGGMLVTCGLDQFGPPSRDGDEELGMHGRVSNLPAKSVGYQASWVGDAYELVVTGEVRQTRVFGENLVLRRRISTALGSNQIHVQDTVTNEGFSAHPHMIMYHVNAGFPMLCEKTRMKFAVEATTPRDELAQQGINDWMVFQPPTPGFLEQVYIHTPAADDKGWANLELDNPVLKLGLRLSFDKATLPYLVEWKMMGEGLYALGIEPINCNAAAGRAAARKQNILPFLEAGESRSYNLTLEVVEIP
jgi:hypothetical protein